MNYLYIIYVIITFALISGLLALLYWIYQQFRTSFATLEVSIEKVVHFTNADPLTGLGNRTVFFEYFKGMIEEAETKEQKIALLFMDIDNFRGIKDRVGYAVGDFFLQMVAKRLVLALQNKKEAIARLSSDQFTILLENGANNKETYEMLERLLSNLAEPYLIQGHEIITTASIGVSVYPEDGRDVETLLKNAGIARYQAKQMGSNTYSFYTPEMNTKIAEQRTIEFHLRKAIEKREFVVCYQPKVDVTTRKIVAAEALLQWNNPELGKVSPAQFIPLAEQTGLIINIGNWILKEACQQTHRWNQDGFSDFSIAINLSAYQFKTGDIAEQIAKVIWETGLDSNLLELELTESLVMENVEKSLLMLRVLKTMGVQVSIDDFGTGYSSLSQLRKFPVDSLKIDQSFVRNINHKNKEMDDKAVITTIITMAKQLGLKVIAEGVETEPQFEFLKSQGCDLIQGYLFSRPIPEEEFTKMLTKNWAEHGKT